MVSGRTGSNKAEWCGAGSSAVLFGKPALLTLLLEQETLPLGAKKELSQVEVLQIAREAKDKEVFLGDPSGEGNRTQLLSGES